MAAYGQSSFSLNRSARRLNVVAQAGTIPPVDENTSGTKLATFDVTHTAAHTHVSCCVHVLRTGSQEALVWQMGRSGGTP